MKTDFIGFVFGLILGFFAGIVVYIALQLPSEEQSWKDRARQDCVRHGFAKFKFDEETGKSKFVWNNNTNYGPGFDYNSKNLFQQLND